MFLCSQQQSGGWSGGIAWVLGNLASPHLMQGKGRNNERKERRSEGGGGGALGFYLCLLVRLWQDPDTEISSSFPKPPLLSEWSREFDSIPVRVPM